MTASRSTNSGHDFDPEEGEQGSAGSLVAGGSAEPPTGQLHQAFGAGDTAHQLRSGLRQAGEMPATRVGPAEKPRRPSRAQTSSACSERPPSREFAAIDPSFEDIDLGLWPGAVTRHGAGPDLGVDSVGVAADGVVRPQIKPGRHGLPVFLAEQRFDLALETDSFSPGKLPVIGEPPIGRDGFACSQGRTPRAKIAIATCPCLRVSTPTITLLGASSAGMVVVMVEPVSGPTGQPVGRVGDQTVTRTRWRNC